MAKKYRWLTETQLKVGGIIMVVFIVILFIYSVNQMRFQVREGDNFVVKNRLLQSNLFYKTEFCANKLSDLAHEIHFFEKDIKEEKEMIKKDDTIRKKEEKVIEIEQEELNDLKNKFQKYKTLCDEFDQNPTKELCSQFLEEAKQNLESSQNNNKISRIYKNLLKECSKFGV